MEQSGRTAELSLSDRVARFALRVILADITFSVGMGLLIAVAWGVRPDSEFLNDLAGGPGGGRGIPAVGFLLTTIISLSSLGVGVWDLVRGRWSGARRLLAFAGPLVIFVGFTYVPHALDPCPGQLPEVAVLVSQSSWERLCEGVDIQPRFHLLYHALVPAVFLVRLYWLAARRWHPVITRRR